MPVGADALWDARTANLDANTIVELCASLADYGEAGGLSRDLMLQVGRYAEGRYADDADVLLAIARMYVAGDEAPRAKAALLRACKLGQDDARVLPLLDQVLRRLGDPRSARQAIREAPQRPALGSVPPPLPELADLPAPRPHPSLWQTTPTTPKLRVEALSRRPRSDRAPDPARIRLLPPDDERRRLDPYELIGEIASGGMATVFLGRLQGAGGFQRFVAIKRLHPHLAREQPFVDMFLDEARIAAGIHNPYVVPILEVGESDRGYYVVMELVEGDTLAGLVHRSLREGALVPPRVAARIAFDALTGLHAAHQLTDADGRLLGLVHRDCTPQNILVGVDGSARITDFGVARAASRLATTKPQQVKGKVGYLSPEQAHGLEIDRRSDVFTMGIVLWEALTGRPLFHADTEAATLTRLISDPIPSVRSFAPSTPPEIDEVCRRALERDRSRRFRTAAEMAEALERASHSGAFGGMSSPRDLGRFVERLLGDDLVAQREAVRAWRAGRDAAPFSRAPRTTPPRSPRGDEGPVTPPAASPRPPSPLPAPPPLPRIELQREPIAEVTLPTAKAASEIREAVARSDAPPASPLRRLLSTKLSAGRWLTLMAVIVVVATAPVWLKVIHELHQDTPAAAARDRPAPNE